MEIGEGVHWLWTLGLTAWILMEDKRTARRIQKLVDSVDGLTIVNGRILDTLRKGSGES